MAREDREETKTIKVAASTHSRLSILATIFDESISDVIDELMEAAYPEVLAETNQVLERMEYLREMVETKRRNKPDK